VAGTAARLYRLSFSGELAYESVSRPIWREALVRHLFAVGARYAVVPYGTELWASCASKRGHPAGNELNGTTTAADLGLGG
jgi:sarcosine oxidase subunit alpha